MSSKLVYSTDQGRIEDKEDTSDQILGSGNVKIQLETKGRKGKGVTLVKELAMTADELKVMAKKLKNHCGVGGAVKDGTIEIQGDQRSKVQAFLADQGIKAKLAGG
ncbi:translation initiation factor [Marinomonas ostreistagni]|uniref:translation initiation factor n=1 Tax=Marinomonas ostreistagni TaxID=359209 RepID=UPI00194E6C28|nr:hypothetical protein [Marinomonas ostreistagni]MBM6550014.1 hypothetical protein [Marinomonas ostreistagni]